jgi:hypothetical protein
VDAVETRERGDHRAEQAFDVEPHGGFDAAADEGARVLQQPDQFVELPQLFGRERLRLFRLGQQEDGHAFVARADRIDQRGGIAGRVSSPAGIDQSTSIACSPVSEVAMPRASLPRPR